MARKAFSIPYPRFILLDKTRIWLGMARKAFYIPYPRFILLDKTRIWLGKHISQEFMISVRPSATHPSVRPSVSAFYPNPNRIGMVAAICSFCPCTRTNSNALNLFGFGEKYSKLHKALSSKRNSTLKKNVERHIRSKWWIVQTDNGMFIEKGTCRAKTNGKELSAMNNISASKAKSESLKVRKIGILLHVAL